MQKRHGFGQRVTETLAASDMTVIIGRMNYSILSQNAGVIVQSLRQKLAQVPKPMPNIVYESLSMLNK